MHHSFCWWASGFSFFLLCYGRCCRDHSWTSLLASLEVRTHSWEWNCSGARHVPLELDRAMPDCFPSQLCPCALLAAVGLCESVLLSGLTTSGMSGLSVHHFSNLGVFKASFRHKRYSVLPKQICPYHRHTWYIWKARVWAHLLHVCG